MLLGLLLFLLLLGMLLGLLLFLLLLSMLLGLLLFLLLLGMLLGLLLFLLLLGMLLGLLLFLLLLGVLLGLLLSRLGLLLSLLCQSRNNGSEGQEQDCCSESCKCFHWNYLNSSVGAEAANSCILLTTAC
jgi:hypothetical protein